MERCEIIDILKEYRDNLFEFIQSHIADLPDVKGLNKAMNRSAFNKLFYICDDGDNIPCGFHADIEAIGINAKDILAAYAAPSGNASIYFLKDRIIIGNQGEIRYSDIQEKEASVISGQIRLVTQQESRRNRFVIMEAYVNFDLFKKCVSSIKGPQA